MKEESIKHLEFIQGIITRLNSNSFFLKGWSITLVSAILALFASNSNVVYLFIAIVPDILFWFLDAYYLQQERKFRGLYNDIVSEESDIQAFSMSIGKYTDGQYSYCKCFWSKTIVSFYVLIAVLLLVAGIALLITTHFTLN